DTNIEKETFSERGIYLYHSFQYHNANEWLLRAYLIDNDYQILFRVGRTHFELKEYSEATRIFGEVIDKSNDLVLIAQSYNYLGLIDLVQGNTNEGIGKICRCVSILYELNPFPGEFNEHNQNTYQNIEWTTIACLYSSYRQIRDEKIIFQLYDAILEEIKKYESLLSPHCMIAEIFSRLSYTVAAHRYLNMGLKEDVPPHIKALLYETKAKIFRKEGNLSRAIELLNKSLDVLPDEPQRIFMEIAQTYESMLNFKEAERFVEKALEHEPDNEEYLRAKEDYHTLAEQVINFNRIPDGDVKTILHSAESLAIRLFNQIDGDLPFDFSIALVEYGKGLETLLHDAIGSEIRTQIHNEFETPIPNKYFYGVWINKDGRKVKKIEPLPDPLKNLLGMVERTISLGKWPGLKNDLEKTLNNPVSKRVSEYFTDEFDGNIDFIENACDVI
ncbi:tetratricopeptide repeat protein, partial [Methanocalculus sp.]|uniref:tetratricopeptide repeat protein n=1 Tax=Methanocalculus sp. TaxID=2004547 RepID=UPI002624863B